MWFFAIASTVMAGLHLYVFVNVAAALHMTGGAKAAAAVVVAALFLLLMTSLRFSRSLPRELASPLAWLVYTWLGSLMLLAVSFLAGDILYVVARALPGTGMDDPSQRELVQRWITLLALAMAAILIGVALWQGTRRVRVREMPVTLRRLPEALHGLRLVQITDLHVGSTLDGDWLRHVVERVNAARPDVVAITGDLVDGSVAELRAHVAPLAELRAPHGIYFVTGNHEYYAGADEWIAYLRELGIRVLRNERVAIQPEPGGAALDLAGIDDHSSHHFPGHGADLGAALAGRNADRAVVLLAHQPAAITAAAAAGVDLQISGHTHGGQIWPWHHMVRLQQPYLAGLHKHPASETQIYISSGTGFWGPPMRLGAPAEITLITLLSVRTGPTATDR